MADTYEPMRISVAEFVGTFLLVLTVGCNVLSNNATWGAVSIASVLMVSIYAFAGVSGGHLNPAVTFALLVGGKLPQGNNFPAGHSIMMTYWASQICGGLAGAIAYYVMFGKGFALAPTPGYAIGALVCELVYTFMLCYVVLNTAASKAKGGRNQYFGLAIGFVIIAGGYAAAAVGAGCFNPAVALAIVAGNKGEGAGWCCAYIAAELLGAFLAVTMFKKVRPEEAEEDKRAPELYGLTSRLWSEAIGTYILVFTVGLNVLGHSKAGAFSIAAALTCMIYATGDVSGGHFNPAVTVGVELCGRKIADWSEASKYIGAQLAGAVLAACSYALVHKGSTFPLGPGIGHDWVSVAVAEFVFTFVLVLVVLCVAVHEKANAPEYVGLIIGSCVTVGGFAVGGISGGALNPAVAAGIAFVHIMGGGLFWKSIVYGIFQLAAGVAAAKVFGVVYPGKEAAAEKGRV